MTHRFNVLLASLVAATTSIVFAVSPAQASPGVDFVCFGQEIVASGGLDLEQENAYLTIDGEEHVLPVTSGAGSPFATYRKDAMTLNFFAPEGDLAIGGFRARCHQTADSIRARALYGKERMQWDDYDAVGKAFQTIRAAPSVLSEKVTSFNTQEEVRILANTNQFMDGFFWFRIGFGDAERGYIWGALLCYNGDEPELQATLRRCN